MEDAGNKIEKMILVVYGLRSKYPERVLDLGELEKEFIKLSTKVENYTRVNFIQEISQILESWKKYKIRKEILAIDEDKISLNDEIIRLDKELKSKQDELKKLEESLNDPKRFIPVPLKNIKMKKVEDLKKEIETIDNEIKRYKDIQIGFEEFDLTNYIPEDINDIYQKLFEIIHPA